MFNFWYFVKCFFCVFSWFLNITATYFCQILTRCCSEMRIVDNQFILHPTSITVLVSCHISVVKRCFSIIQRSYQLWYIIKLFKIKGATVKRLVFCIYLYLGHLYKEKVDKYTGVNYLWLISSFCQKNVFP